MAKKSGNKSDEELKQEVARSREDLALRLERVREEADLPRKIRRSVQREPVPWIIGAIAVGLLLTAVISRKKKKIYVDTKAAKASKSALLEAGFLLGALRIAASLLKPVILNFVEKKLGTYSSRGRPGPKSF
jgi:hypothetical protein